MRYLVLACDYDGTLATDGQLDDATVAALGRLLDSGRRLVMVTGRELDELQTVCPHLELFEWIVAENGGLLYHPATRQEKPLAAAPSELFLQALAARGVTPVSVGRVIVATWHPHETTVLEAIRDLGLELQVIFNKGAVMILPSGVNKATGLQAALEEMKLSPHNAVAVGDAENDHAFFNLCECAVAVANALPLLKERADWTTAGDHGAGVAELIDRLAADDLADLNGRLQRHYLQLGTRADGSPVELAPYRKNILVAGTSGGGKSTLATGFMERLAEKKYQFCVIDPEGDFGDVPEIVSLGKKLQLPNLEEVLSLLEYPRRNVAVNLIGIPFGDRPAFFASLMTRLQELRTRTGRPHWIIVDEAHHVLPASWEPSKLALPQQFDRTLLVTLEPDRIAKPVLAEVEMVVAVGEQPSETLDAFAEAVGIAAPRIGEVHLKPGNVMVWPAAGEAPFEMTIAASRIERKRHSRKYVEGEMEPERSFYFRGPEGKLNLRAQNLILFLQIAAGVDDPTWLHHLHAGDYSHWFREYIKDDALADEAARVEAMPVSAAASREQIKQLIEEHFTLPAAGPAPTPADGAATIPSK